MTEKQMEQILDAAFKAVASRPVKRIFPDMPIKQISSEKMECVLDTSFRAVVGYAPTVWDCFDVS